VRNREGAAFHRGLDLAPVNLVLRKGFRENLDSYSAFFENDRATPTGVVSDAVRGVGFPEGSVERAFKRLEEAGVIIAGSGEIL
jgi:nicotinamidase/pyrazinamidase